MNAILAAWAMSLDGVKAAYELLKNSGDVSGAVKKAINTVEDNPEFSSVGYGGLPNREGDVELDAAYMDGSTGYYGGILGAKGIANPIDAAIELSKRHMNCLLSGTGAEHFARLQGFRFQNMLTRESKKRWEEELAKEREQLPGAYRGHDTVCVIAAREKHIAAGVSTSGLFMKDPGRIGDSPIVGAGLYADSAVGAASATGVGEDIIRGCLSYEVVRLMEQGRPAQEACKEALAAYLARMSRKGFTPKDVSLIALGADGSFGGATNLKDGDFTFVYADETHPAAVWTIAGGVQKLQGPA
ncbi:MAG: isoaspartyl peptidase/L-asparaginase [Treponema sp.]|jgi:isoaspartyl peptidase/L-asparaginase-like protein (Ntn-hydrolase superfamily)|nr:isoaspartyl peptidase/L-asparaginase [Treponema sp.]